MHDVANFQKNESIYKEESIYRVSYNLQVISRGQIEQAKLDKKFRIIMLFFAACKYCCVRRISPNTAFLATMNAWDSSLVCMFIFINCLVNYCENHKINFLI